MRSWKTQPSFVWDGAAKLTLFNLQMKISFSAGLTIYSLLSAKRQEGTGWAEGLDLPPKTSKRNYARENDEVSITLAEQTYVVHICCRASQPAGRHNWLHQRDVAATLQCWQKTPSQSIQRAISSSFAPSPTGLSKGSLVVNFLRVLFLWNSSAPI